METLTEREKAILIIIISTLLHNMEKCRGLNITPDDLENVLLKLTGENNL